jgi:hypothetical protein
MTIVHVRYWTDIESNGPHHVWMKKKDLTSQQANAVSCPTCGVDAGQLCILTTGANRTEPHLNRKLAAMETLERKLDPQE